MFIKYYSDAGCGEAEGSGDGSSNTRSPAPLVPAPDGLQHHSDGEGAHEVEGGHMVESLAV